MITRLTGVHDYIKENHAISAWFSFILIHCPHLGGAVQIGWSDCCGRENKYPPAQRANIYCWKDYLIIPDILDAITPPQRFHTELKYLISSSDNSGVSSIHLVCFISPHICVAFVSGFFLNAS